jgi:hypothetical protein
MEGSARVAGVGRIEPVRGLLGRALLPGLEVRQKYPLHTIAKRPTDAEHCRKVVAPRTGHELPLIGRTGYLVQIAADAAKLADGALEGQQLLRRQRRKRP